MGFLTRVFGLGFWVLWAANFAAQMGFWVFVKMLKMGQNELESLGEIEKTFTGTKFKQF